MTTSTSIAEKLQSLRQDFDRSFARANDGQQQAELDFLAVSVAGDRYALRLSEVQSLHADRKLVLAPSLLPELLGLSNFRSVLTPVYDLAQLLGYGAGGEARWLAVVRSVSPIAFAFQNFDSHFRVSAELSPAQATEGTDKTALGGAVQNAGVTLPLLDLPSLVEGIAQRIKAFGPSQER